jgi:hypothetical protein
VPGTGATVGCESLHGTDQRALAGCALGSKQQQRNGGQARTHGIQGSHRVVQMPLCVYDCRLPVWLYEPPYKPSVGSPQGFPLLF